MFGRPNLHTSYRSETAMLPTWTQRTMMALLIVVLVLLPFQVPIVESIPVVRYLGDADWMRLTTQALIFAIAALGLNLLTGVAGQVSLGHAFFMGTGAYAAAVLGGEAGPRVGTRAPDLDLVARCRHHRRPHRRDRGAGGRSAAWALPRHRHRRTGVHRHPSVAGVPADLGRSRGRAQLPAARVQLVERARTR